MKYGSEKIRQVEKIKLIARYLIAYIFLSLLFMPKMSFARNSATIQGQVLDQLNKRPIHNVNVYFQSKDLGTITDKNGNFVITNAPIGGNELIVKHIGYNEKRMQLNLKENEKTNLQIFLVPAAIEFDEIVYTANRRVESIFESQQDVAVAGQEKIDARSSPNTADAIREVPGVLVQKTTAGHGAPIIRGQIGKNVLLLYNGIRLNKPTFRFGANQYMNTISVEDLARIEVNKGPGSVMYGSDAMGGVINMISPEHDFGGQGNQTSSSLALRYSSADQSQVAHAGLGKNFGRFSLLVGITGKKIGDLQAGENIGEQIPTGYTENNSNIRLGIKISNSTILDFDLLAVRQHEVPRYDKYVTDEYQKYIYDPQNRYLSAMTIRSNPQKINWISSIQWNFSYQLEEEGKIQQKTGQDAIVKNQNDLTSWGSYLQINSIWRSRHIFTYGYEIYHHKISSSQTRKLNGVIEPRRGNFPDGSTYRSIGLFVNDNITLNAKFDFNIGLRWSQIHLSALLGQPFGDFDDNYSDVTGTFGLSFKAYSWLNVIGRYSKGFRAPNFNDTIVLKVSNSGVDAPSPGLSPEKSHNFEIGLKMRNDKMSGSLFMFYNRMVDLIDRYKGTYNGLDFFDDDGDGVRDPDEVDIYQKRNVAKAYIAGWELSGQIHFSPAWSVSGFLFWTYGQNLTFDEPLSRIPPLMGMVNLQYQFNQNIKLETFFRAATKQDRLSSRDVDDIRIPEGGTPGWKTFNLRGSFRVFENISFRVTLANIFDETYKEHGSGVYSPGRSMVLNLGYRMN